MAYAVAVPDRSATSAPVAAGTLGRMGTQSYDLVVIGSGPAGQKGAIAAAKLGKRVAIVDKRDMLGGVSLHGGTVPSKTLREAAWLPSLVFIVFIFPARLLTGWALGRAEKRPTPRHWFWRWTAWFPMLPMTAIYVFFLFFTQYTAWNGIWSLYEQHAFMLPVPFMGM